MLMIIEVESSRLLDKRCARGKGNGERLDALSANERFAETAGANAGGDFTIDSHRKLEEVGKADGESLRVAGQVGCGLRGMSCCNQSSPVAQSHALSLPVVMCACQDEDTISYQEETRGVMLLCILSLS